MSSAGNITTIEVKQVTKDLEDYIRTNDPIRGTYTLYFCKDGFNKRARLFVTYGGEKILGYLFMFDAVKDGLFWIYTYSESSAIPSLISSLPTKPSIITTNLSTSEGLKTYLKNYDLETELIMVFSGNKLHLADSSRTVRLTRQNKAEYAKFKNQENGEVAKEQIKMAGDFLEEEIVFGLFSVEGALASISQIHARANHNWIISGVETLPQYRRSGYSREIVSALTDFALNHVDSVSLFVDSENKAAINLYRDLGYETVEDGIRLICNF